MSLGELIEQLRRVGDQFNSWYLIDTNVESIDLINDTIVVKLKKESFDENRMNFILDEAEKMRESAIGREKTGGWYWRKWAEWGYRKAIEVMEGMK